MSNYFRDNALGFKPRSNIFSKLRVKDSVHDSEILNNSESSNVQSALYTKIDGLNSSSIDDCQKNDISNIVESTPKSKNLTLRNLHIGGAVDEEELEITEVRCVGSNEAGTEDAVCGKSSQIKLKSKTASQESGETSTNDVLLEAFTNTQRICTNLKVELQRQKIENQDQKQEILTYKTEVRKINERMSQYQQFLANMEEKSKCLQAQKMSDESSLSELKESYKKMQEKIKEYSKDYSTLKHSLENMKSSQRNSEFEMSKRLKELEYLKKELNTCSGHLSEEKIKNSDLLQELKASREQSKQMVEKVLKNVGNDFKKELSSLSDAVSVEKSTVGKTSKEVTNLGKIVTQISESLAKNQNVRPNSDAIQFIQEGFRDFESGLQRQLDSNFRKINQQLPATKELAKTLTSISKALEDTGFIDINRKLNQPVVVLKPLVDNVLDSLGMISKNINMFKQQGEQTQQCQQTIKDLQQQFHSHLSQRNETMIIMKGKDAQIDGLNKNIAQNNCLFDEMSKTEQGLKEDLAKLKEKFDAKRRAAEQLSKELNSAHSSFDSKFSAQTEILRMITEERDSLRIKMAKINQSKDVSEREVDTAKQRAHNINDQLQKLNVEVVQSKARELELDEDNRKLKNIMEQMNLDARESGDLLRELKRRIASLESDKKTSANEKLELHDKINLLQQQLQTARKHVQELKDQRHKVPQIKKSGEEVQKVPSKGERQEGDAFDLSSSSNDDLELTNPSPIQIKPMKSKKAFHGGKAFLATNKKKLLLFDENENVEARMPGKKRRRY